jgi:hypothetical protein
MFKIKKLKTAEEFIEYTKLFNQAIGYSNVPWQYYASGDVYALIVNNKMQAGFVLIPGYFNLRSILQIPDEIQVKYFNENPKIALHLCDNTGYFINTVSFWQGIIFTLFLTIICLFYREKYFVYTYPVTDVALQKYYGSGNPIRIHTGIPEHLPGHSDHMESEHVEILSKLGIIKIFIYRTKRILRAKKIEKKLAARRKNNV